MPSRLFLIIKSVLVVFMIMLPISAYSFTFNFDFDDEVVGQKTNSFSDAAGYSIVTNEESYSGDKSARMSIDGGTEGFGYWGGRKILPTLLKEGEEVWVRLRVKVPVDFDYNTNIYALKFLRLRVRESGGKHLGYVDMYIRGDGSMRYQNELETTTRLDIQDKLGAFSVGETITGQTSGTKAIVRADKSTGLVYQYSGSTPFVRWEKIIGESSNSTATIIRMASNSVTNFGAAGTFAKGVWKTYIYRIRFSASWPLVQFYESVGSSYNLMFEDTTDYTLKSSTNVVDSFLLFTYWNGSSPKTQHLFVDDLYISTEPPPELGARPKKPLQKPLL